MKMDAKESKLKMIARLAAMKQELAKKTKKLRKSQRVANIKAHVRQKLKECNNTNETEEESKHQFEMSNKITACSDNDEGSLFLTREKTFSQCTMHTFPNTKNGDGSLMMTKRNFEKVKEDVLDESERVPDRLNEFSKDSLFPKKKYSKISNDTCKEKIESKLQGDVRVLNSKQENVRTISNGHFSPSPEENFSSYASSGSSETVDELTSKPSLLEEKRPSVSENSTSRVPKEIIDKSSPHSHWKSSQDAIHFESELIFASCKSLPKKKFPTQYQLNKGDHNISNSQFLKILKLSQPVDLTPNVTVLNEDRRHAPAKLKKQGKNQASNLDILDDKRVTPTLCLGPEKIHTQNEIDQISSSLSDKGLNSEINSLHEYTELDIISYSQFQLTEDFLSENSSSSQLELTHSQHKVKRSVIRSLIKRTSPRISAITHSASSNSSNVSILTEPSVPKYPYSAKRSGRISIGKGRRLTDEKAAAVLSVFQFLIDETKRQTDKEFQLPATFQDLINIKINQCIYNDSDKSEEMNNSPLFLENISQLEELSNERCCASIHSAEVRNMAISEEEINNRENIDELQRCVESNANGESQNGVSLLTHNHAETKDSLALYQSPSHSQSQDIVDETDICNAVLQSHHHRQWEHASSKESPESGIRKNSDVETNSSFIPSSPCLRTIRGSMKRKNISSSLDHRSKIKSKEMSAKEDSNKKIHEALGETSPQVATGYGKETTMETDGHFIFSSCDSDKSIKQHNQNFSEKVDKSIILTLSDQHNSHLLTIQDSLKIKTSKNVKTCHSTPKLPSSSTPISNVRSRSKASCLNVRSLQFSEVTESSFNEVKQISNAPMKANTKQQNRAEMFCSFDQSSHIKEAVEENENVTFDDLDANDTLPSGQNTLRNEIPACNIDEEDEKISEISLIASPISKWSDGHLPTEGIVPWKKISRTPFTPLRIWEKRSDVSDCGNLLSPTFIYGKLGNRESLPRPIRQDVEVKSKGHALNFAGCFQSCSEDSVVQLLYCELQTDQSDGTKVYLVSVQASALTVWAQDVDGYGWIPELDWRLSSEIHILDACFLLPVTNIIGIAAFGWEENQFFATVFVYDVVNDITNRFNLPTLEQNMGSKNVREIHFCCISSTRLLMGISSTGNHTIRSVFFKDGIQGVATTSLFRPHRGALLALRACPDIPKVCFGLTGDQKFVIWHIELESVLKSIQLPSAIPCLTSLMSVMTLKGFLLLTVTWKIDKSDSGGIILLNAATGKASRYCDYKMPNSGWKRVKSMKMYNKCVIAISSSGSVCWWTHLRGSLLGHRKSNSATCATLIKDNSILIGEIHGCVHIYSIDK